MNMMDFIYSDETKNELNNNSNNNSYNELNNEKYIITCKNCDYWINDVLNTGKSPYCMYYSETVPVVYKTFKDDLPLNNVDKLCSHFMSKGIMQYTDLYKNTIKPASCFNCACGGEDVIVGYDVNNKSIKITNTHCEKCSAKDTTCNGCHGGNGDMYTYIKDADKECMCYQSKDENKNKAIYEKIKKNINHLNCESFNLNKNDNNDNVKKYIVDKINNKVNNKFDNKNDEKINKEDKKTDEETIKRNEDEKNLILSLNDKFIQSFLSVINNNKLLIGYDIEYDDEFKELSFKITYEDYKG